jgi:hypothetical protein
LLSARRQPKRDAAHFSAVTRRGLARQMAKVVEARVEATRPLEALRKCPSQPAGLAGPRSLSGTGWQRARSLL